MTRSLLLALASLAIVDLMGNLRGYGLLALEGVVASTAAGAALVGLALGWSWRSEEGKPDLPAWMARALTFLPAVALGLSVVGNRFLREMAWGGAAWAGLGLTVAALVVLALLRRPAAVAAVALAAGLALRAITFHLSALNMGGDMIPLVHRAAGNLLQGRSPYAVYHLPWTLPLTYLPGTLLPFAGGRQIGLHPRWVNAAAEIVALAAVLWAAARTGGPGDRLKTLSRHPVLPVAAALYLLPSSLEFARISTAPVAWATLAFMLAAVTLRRRAEAPLSGLAAATTPFAAVFLPLVAVAWLKTHGRRGLGRRLLIAVAVAAILIVPFFAWAPGAFIDGTVLWFNDLDRFPRLRWREARPWVQYPGFSGLFWLVGLERLLKPLQLAAWAGVIALYVRRGAAPSALPAHAAAGYLLFIVVNPVLWAYFYQPALFAGLLSLATAGASVTVQTSRGRPA